MYDLTLYERLKRGSDTFGERTLFTYQKEERIVTVSFREFFKDVRKMAYGLEERHLKGKCVVIEGKTQYESMVALCATVVTGAVAAVLNFDLPEEEIAYAMECLAPAMIICSEDNYDVAEPYRKETVACLVFEGEVENTETIFDWLKDRETLYEYTGDQKPEDPAIVLMTSGSTSKSKLVLLSQYAFLPAFETYAEKNILLFPMHHVAGTAVLATAIANGVQLCLSDMRDGLYAMEWFKPEAMVAVPAFISCVVDRVKKNLLDISELKYVTSVGAPQNLESTQYLESVGIFASSAYGATETGGAVSAASPERCRYGSVGQKKPWNEVQISETGEILVKGKNVMLEYVGDPEETKAALKDGWYYSGDIGYFDEDGYLYLTGRVKNVIVLSNGENVSPEAIESQLYLCPEIEEVIVCGEDDTLVGQVWCGKIADEALQKEVERYIKQYNRNVPSYRCIRKIVFRETPFAKSASGKIKRNEN